MCHDVRVFLDVEVDGVRCLARHNLQSDIRRCMESCVGMDAQDMLSGLVACVADYFPLSKSMYGIWLNRDYGNSQCARYLFTVDDTSMLLCLARDITIMHPDCSVEISFEKPGLQCYLEVGKVLRAMLHGYTSVSDHTHHEEV